MARPLGPRAKKALDYRRTRRLQAEYPDRYRKALPKKKQLRNQQYRTLLGRALRDQLRRVELSLEDVAPETPRRRKSVRIGRNVPLGRSVRDRLDRRAAHAGWNLRKRGYDPEHDREPATAFFVALTAGASSRLREEARYWQAALDPPPPVVRPWSPGYSAAPGRYYSLERVLWLSAFLADQPVWEGRLRRWIEAALALPPVGPASWRRPGA